MADGHQVRGWKDIAAYVGTSVRTARRWEAERGLPVRRQPGGARELVLAFREDLDLWQRSNPMRGEAPTELTATVGVVVPMGVPVSVPPAGRSRRLLSWAAGTLVAVAICAIGYFSASRMWSPTTPAVILPSVRLDIARPDGWRVTIRVPDGGAGQIGGSANRPALILRPRVVQAGVLLEITRADGQPLKEQGDRPDPMVVLLERNVTVHLRQPFRFSVEWLSAEPPGEADDHTGVRPSPPASSETR